MVKKLVKVMPLIAIPLIIFGANTNSLAQGTPLACQDEAAGGLDWKNNRWSVTGFHGNKFILVLEGGLVSEESAAKALNATGGVSCSKQPMDRISCHDRFGGSLYFDPKALRGAVAQTFGSTMVEKESRDSVAVRVFSCQQF